MSAKKATKFKTANAGANLYDGFFEILFDCVGVEKCARAQFFCNPPDSDDDCAWHQNGTCMSASARKAALEKIRDGIAAELEEYQEEGVNV